MVAVSCLLGSVVPAGCSSPPPQPRGTAPVATVDLPASVTQFRYDEGTRHLKAAVVNHGRRAVRVTRATIDWDGMAFTRVAVDDAPVPPGQAAAFAVSYTAPHCDSAPSDRPTLVAVVDGRTRRLRLQVEDPGLLDRLRAKACAQQRLAAVAEVSLRLARHTEVVGGAEYVPGALVLRRVGEGPALRVVDFKGSVLLDLGPRRGPRALPAGLAPGRERLVLPVLLGSVHRCDAHALGQSQQTFLLSTYVAVGRRPPLRVVLPLTSAEQERAIGVVDRDCR